MREHGSKTARWVISATAPSVTRETSMTRIVYAITVGILWAALSVGSSRAETPATEPADLTLNDAEAWAIGEILAGRVADFAHRCGGALDLWNHDLNIGDECRSIRGIFVRNALLQNNRTRASLSSQISINSAEIVDDVDMDGASINKVAIITGSIFRGTVSFSNARFDSTFSLNGSSFEKGISFNGARVAGALLMRETHIHGGVDLISATIGTNVEFTGAHVMDGFRANGLRVGRSVLANQLKIESGELSLVSSNISGDLELGGLQASSDINLNSILINGTLYINQESKITGAAIHLSTATIQGDVFFQGISVARGIIARRLRLSGTLFLTDSPSIRGVLNLNAATMAGGIVLAGATIQEELNAEAARIGSGIIVQGDSFLLGGVNLKRSRVEGDIWLNRSYIGGNFTLDMASVSGVLSFIETTVLGELFLSSARFGGDVILAGARLRSVSLAGSVALGDLFLANAEHHGVDWFSGHGVIDLTGARFRAIQYSLGESGGRNSWPPNGGVYLTGLTYDRVVTLRSFAVFAPEIYTEWLQMTPTFSRQPYQQLASTLRSSGEFEHANDVLFASRDRELNMNWVEGDCRILLNWTGERCLNAIGLWFVKSTIGYGLGWRYTYIFYWIISLTAAGYLVLSYAPHARDHSRMWRVLASLDALLPIIELNKEFTDFFNDPKRRWSNDWYILYFSFHSIAGYALASCVVAGLAGFTQAR